MCWLRKPEQGEESSSWSSITVSFVSLYIHNLLHYIISPSFRRRGEFIQFILSGNQVNRFSLQYNYPISIIQIERKPKKTEMSKKFENERNSRENSWGNINKKKSVQVAVVIALSTHSLLNYSRRYGCCRCYSNVLFYSRNVVRVTTGRWWRCPTKTKTGMTAIPNEENEKIKLCRTKHLLYHSTFLVNGQSRHFEKCNNNAVEAKIIGVCIWNRCFFFFIKIPLFK